MVFAGLSLGTLIGIAAAASAATVLLYVLKLRRRPVAVPFSPIWERVLRDRDATQLFSRLKRLLSLLLQLLLLALLILALGDPRMSANLVEGRNIVVLVDASASMKSTDVEPSRIERAKARTQELVRGLGSSDRMLVAKMDATVTPLSTLTGDTGELFEAVASIEATDTRADLPRALSFALDSLRGLTKPEILLVSDGALHGRDALPPHVDLSGVTLTYIPVGKSGENVALTGFSARRYPLDKSRYEVMLEVTNTTDEAARVELTLLGDGEVVDVSELALGPRERLPRFYQDLAGASERLEARLRRVDGKPDHLPADDRAFALMPERRRARVLVVTPGNTYLEAALLLDEYLDVTLVAPDGALPGETFDVAILDGVAPPLGDRARAALYIAPPAEGAPVEHRREIQDFGFDVWDRKHALLRWMAVENIQVAVGHALSPQKGDHVVGASEKGPLLVSGKRDGRRFVALGFDPRNSDMVLRVAWPLFLLNTIQHFVEEDVGYISSYRTGDVWRIPVPGDPDVAVLEDPKGRRREVPVKEGYAVYLGELAGFYGVTTDSKAAEPVTARFAANLSDVAESHIEPVADLSLSGTAPGEPQSFEAGVRHEIWLYLLLAAALLSILEWATYHRRVTV